MLQMTIPGERDERVGNAEQKYCAHQAMIRCAARSSNAPSIAPVALCLPASSQFFQLFPVLAPMNRESSYALRGIATVFSS
jgi:hypothetical protein